MGYPVFALGPLAPGHPPSSPIYHPPRCQTNRDMKIIERTLKQFANQISNSGTNASTLKPRPTVGFLNSQLASSANLRLFFTS